MYCYLVVDCEFCCPCGTYIFRLFAALSTAHECAVFLLGLVISAVPVALGFFLLYLRHMNVLFSCCGLRFLLFLGTWIFGPSFGA
jgi:hypothetical protein